MELSTEKIWSAAQEHLRSNMNADTYNMWFAPLRASAIGRTATYPWKRQTNFARFGSRTIIWDCCKRLLHRRRPPVASQIQDRHLEARLTAHNVYANANQSENRRSRSERASHGELHFNPKNTFESFVVGNNNNFSYAAALAVAQRPANPTIRFFFTAVSDWAKHICFMPLASTSAQQKRRASRLRFVREIHQRIH